VEFRILGPLQVVEDGQDVPITGPRERALIAMLALRAGHVVSVERLIDMLWGDRPPRNPANALQALIARTRKALGRRGRQVLATREPGYLLAVARDQVDVLRFEDLLSQAREIKDADSDAAASLLRQALNLWRGPPLEEMSEFSGVPQEIQRLEQMRLAALEDRIQADLAAGRHSEVIGELESLIAGYPLQERFHGQLMLALYRDGRQADALEAYQRIRSVLGEELGLDPAPDLQQLHERILRHDPGLATRPSPVHTGLHNLPNRISRFIGRTTEIADLRRLLRHRRLVTVMGPGGSGKTSLAVEVAKQFLDDGESEATDLFFVDLAPVTAETHVTAAVAAALGLRGGPGSASGGLTPLELQIADFLRAKQPLLILIDNCEHVINAAARITEAMLQAGAESRILATSREPLGITGEVIWSIPGMAAPVELVPTEELADFDAVRLFAERAAEARPGFSLDAQTAQLTAEISRRLDGMPLAIELAAARARTLPLTEIARRLDDRFRLLTSSARTAVTRHQTLYAAIDWSYQLLGEPERLLFVRSSVFSGSWTVEDAEAVCSDQNLHTDEILDMLTRLSDRSLIKPEPETQARFRMLESIREFARQRLQVLGETERLGRRHALHFLRVAEARGAHPENLGWLRAVEEAADDIRSALQWGIRSSSEQILLRFAGALGWHWATWHDQEGITWTTDILAAVHPRSTAEYGRALLASAFVNSYAPSPATKAQAMQSVTLLEHCGDRSSAGQARLILGFIELMLGGDPHFTRQQIAVADHEFVEVGDKWGQAFAALSRFRLHLHIGSVAASTATGREALGRFQDLKDPWGVPWTTLWLGIATRMVGDIDEAKHLFSAAIAVSEQLAYVRCYAHAELGNLAALEGDHQLASRHHHRCEQLAPATGVRDSLAMAANAAGVGSRIRGDPEAARMLHLRALAIYEELGSDIGKAHTGCCLGYAEQHLGQHGSAEGQFRRGLELADRIGRLDTIIVALEGLATVVASRDANSSALLLGLARRIRRDTGIGLTVIEGRETARTETQVRSELGEQGFRAAIAEANSLPEEAVRHPFHSIVQALS
jgi:predicted ATPase/DNA-binding SARP family transcriptional activator